MGIVMVKVRLANFTDLQNLKQRRIEPEAVRSLEIEALVDTGAIALAIPEELAEALGVDVIGIDTVRVADGRTLDVAIVGGLYIEVLGRSMTGDALVLPRGTKPLLGAIQLEMLDLVVVPKTGVVITNPEHPNGRVLPLLRAS